MQGDFWHGSIQNIVWQERDGVILNKTISRADHLVLFASQLGGYGGIFCEKPNNE